MSILNDFRDYVRQEAELVELSKRGIKGLASAVPMTKALTKFDFGDGRRNVTPEDVAEAQQVADRAGVEIASEFRLLHGHSLVGLWGALETMVIDLAVSWLLNVPNAREVDAISRVKVSVAEFEAMEPEDRMLAIVHELDRSQGQRAGIGRFETLLDPLLLSGSYPALLGENLFFVQQLRNVFAHRRGVADRRFAAACPFMGLGDGEDVPCGHEMWTEALHTIVAYGLLVRNRVGTAFEQPPAELIDFRPLRDVAIDSANLSSGRNLPGRG